MKSAWESRAAALALPLRKIKERLAAGSSFTAAEVDQAMKVCTDFYMTEGAVKAYAEIISVLEGGAPPGKPGGWRLP